MSKLVVGGIQVFMVYLKGSDEKRGGRRHPYNLLMEFTEVLNECGLHDLGFVGEKFTWERGRGQQHWVQERLDRGVTTQSWRDIFPLAEVQTIEVSTSGHLPLYPNLMKQVYVPRGKIFRKKNNNIDRIKDVNGEWQESKEEIRGVIENYFEELFTSSNTPDQLSSGERVTQITKRVNEELLQEVHEDEVKEAVFAMHPDKACGPEGLNPDFFQVFWDIVKHDVINFCRRFIQLGELPSEVNEIVICLIPKVKAPTRVTQVIISVSYKFLHNGEEFGHVAPRRGLRQGDPMSPYIYFMYAEGLSSIIRRNKEVGLITGCKIARDALPISHSLFADDCYFFFKANTREANSMKNILHRYADVSGQVVNLTKSAITFSSNTSRESKIAVCNILGVGESGNPSKYIGMPMRIGQNKQAVFSFLVDRVEQKLQTWSVQSVSKAGKVTLLKTAAQSIPNFWMGLFFIPAGICENIERSMNAYWWGTGNEKKGIRWINWRECARLKKLEVEDTSHVLFTCNAARELWCELGEHSLLRVGGGESVREVLKRNVWVWERTFIPVFGVHSMVTNLLQDWRKSQDVAGVAGAGAAEGWLKINIDAACPHQRAEVSVACVVRDDRGAFVGARSNIVPGGRKRREAEALGL
ncbi:uncharacterized protein LOC141673815 [Apium graveolens]|uniref:uncharacterized protein LOC141673815 n=1 Tax=Apium graveolens TaxID=4045 RepID=UPI003D79D359